MRGSSALGLFFLLRCSHTGALVPSARLLSASRRMVGLRRRIPLAVVSSEVEDSHAGIGSLFWKRKTRLAGDDRAEEQQLGNAASVAAPPAADHGGASATSVIHLGKLRIPQSRRLNLAVTRAGADATIHSSRAAVSQPDAAVENAAVDSGKQEEERREWERLIEVDGHRAAIAPSVIPFGVGEGDFQSGVVQIPLRYTVGQTVDFIRTVATVDQDYLRTAKPVEGRASGLHRGDDGLNATLSSRIYVTERGTLKGYITMAALLTHQPDTPVLDLLRDLEELLREGDSWEHAAHRLRQANVMAAPVVDEDGVLVAVLNPSDLLQEMEIEATDDIMRQSGSGGGESYFGTPLPRLVASRVGWLVSLLCLQSFSSLILQRFQLVIEKNIVIALFLTMLTGTAGNAGNQSSAIVIRGLATGEIHQGNRWRVVWREARAAVASACVLSVASYFRVLLTPGATTVATLAVAISMGATVIGAVMFGTIAPIVLDGMGVDPVNFASPALATLTDVSGVFILCYIAKLMLGM